MLFIKNNNDQKEAGIVTYYVVKDYKCLNILS